MKKKILSTLLIFVILFTNYSFVLGGDDTTNNSEGGTQNTGENTELYDFSTAVYSDIKLNAIWTPISYNIVYDLNGGELPNGVTNPTSYTVETPTFTLNNPTREGYSFTGWTGSNGTTAQTSVSIPIGSTEDKSYTANWQVRTDTPYTVQHYKENLDGTYTLAETENKMGETDTVATAVAKSYIGFTEYTTHPGRINSGTINANGTLVLKLYYQRLIYTVTFDSKGGSFVQSQTVKYQNKATEPNDPTRTGFTFNGWKKTGESNIYDFDTEVTSNITLEAYWTPDIYNINYVLNNGQNNSQNPSTYTIEDTITFKDATRQGYTFKGWYEDATFTKVITNISNRTGDITLYAKWEPKTDTEYTVEHYKKDRNGQYQLEETESLNGITGTTVTAQKKTYRAFVENTSYAERVNEGIIAPDGSLVLKLYYDPIIYTIDYELNGGKNSIRNPSTYTIYDVINFEPATRVGYTFLGWYEDRAFTTQISTLSNRAENITLYAKWSPKGDTLYKVEHHRANKDGEYSLYETELLMGTTDEAVTAVPKAYTGFKENITHAERVNSGTVAGDGSLVLKLFYERVKYKVSFDPKNGTTIEDQIVVYQGKSTEPQRPTKRGYTFTGWKERGKTELFDFDTEIIQDTYLVAEWKPIIYRINYVLDGGENHPQNPSTYTRDDTVVFRDPSKTGYNFGGWFEDTAFTTGISTFSDRSGDVTVYAKWIPRDDTAYSVQHYKKTNGSYQLAETEQLRGTTNTMALATAKTYRGYKENTSYEERRNAGVIQPDGSLVLKLFYDPIIYKIDYVLYGGENDSRNPATYTINDTINLQNATKQGYTFRGWYEEPSYVNYLGTIANRTEDLTLHAKWEANTNTLYKVEHYKETENGRYELDATEELRGTTDSLVTASPKEFVGYHENTTYPERIEKGNVKADGSLVLKLYYDKDIFTVTFDPKNGNLEKNQLVKYQEKATKPVDPSKTGYSFGGWKEKNKTELYDFDTPVTSNKDLEAIWTPVVYNIEYELNGGTNNSTNPSTYTIEDNITLKPGTRLGYDFIKWYEDSAFTVEIDSIKDRTGDIKVYAKWNARTDTRYKVEHYKQDQEGQYILADTDTLQGTTGTNINATPKEYAGYRENQNYEGRVSQGFIKADGSLVLKLYYDRIIYRIDYETNGGRNDIRNPHQYTVEDTITFLEATKLGYNFDGWYEDSAFTNKIESISNRIGDIKLYAKWVPSGDTLYKVEHYRETNNGQYVLYDIDNIRDYTDKEVTAVPKVYEGFKENTTHPERIEKGNVKPDESLVLKLFYEKLKYTVTFDPKNGDSIPNQVVKYQDKATEPVDPTRKGYSFDGWKEKDKTELYDFDTPVTSNKDLEAIWTPVIYNIEYELNGGINDETNPSTYTIEDDITLKPGTRLGHDFIKWYEDPIFTVEIDSIKNRTGDITVYAKWLPRNDTPYKVEHHKMNADGYYELSDVDYLKGTTGTMVVAQPKQYAGYKEKELLPYRVNSGIVAADGSLVLKLYYEPIIYKINYVLNGGENNKQNPSTYTVNDNITLKDATKPGYNFEGWYSDPTYTQRITSIYNRTEDITLYAKWDARTDIQYIVEHYKENADGEYDLTDRDILKGTMDKDVIAIARSYDGYRENTIHPDRIAQGTIKANESLVLKLYYKRLKYTVTFDTKNGTPIEDQIVKYMDKAEEPQIPTKSGYEFVGWKEKYQKDIYNFDTPITADLELEAIWKPRDYSIEYVLNGGKNDSRNPLTYTKDDVIKLKPATRDGYTFLGWFEDAAFTVAIDTISNRSGNIAVYAKWVAKNGVLYKVEHYKMNNQGRYEIAEFEKLTGKTDQLVVAIPKSYSGYTENQDYKERVDKGIVKADGSLVLRLYYDRVNKINIQEQSQNPNYAKGKIPQTGIFNIAKVITIAIALALVVISGIKYFKIKKKGKD